ncbi:protein kinase domain-containing protein [Actinomadura miaoliensis]|uniref:non-specific serine/threonine protein kinase n=1 Tax=Actinomadura miaoliensis TaxID=430685 RepID=A0ABP7WV29_9ACTN
MSQIPGGRLGGRYQLVAPVGSGGMATVWRAVDLVLDRPVAVKLPRDGWPRELTPRLHEEAKAAASLTHPHITGVYDYGEADLPDGERLPYVVMELLDGESLATRLARGPLPWREAAVLGAQLADALAAAHAAGVVHRDVKPGNVLLTATGAKILDFGIAFTAPAGGRPDGAGPVLGTPAYVAPELLGGAAPTPAADVYSLGVLLRESLAGDEPAQGAPEQVERLWRRCVDERPEARPSAAEVAAVLRAAAGIPQDAVVGATTAPPPHGPARDHHTRVLDDPRPPPAPSPGSGARRPLLLVVGGVVGALGLFALLLVALSPESSGGGAAGPAPGHGASSSGAGECAVSYDVVGEWPDGFQARVRVTNLADAPLDGWRLAWSFPDGQRVAQLWNGAQRQQGSDVEVTAAGWNRTIPPRGVVEFGFIGRQDGGNGRPGRFTLNGRDCRSAQ